MKTQIFSILFLTVFINVHCQELDIENIKKNEIDLSVSDLIDGAFQFKYERLLSEHFSVALGVGYKGEDGLISLSGLDTEKIKDQ